MKLLQTLVEAPLSMCVRVAEDGQARHRALLASVKRVGVRLLFVPFWLER